MNGKKMVCRMGFVGILGILAYTAFLLVAFYYGFLSTPYSVNFAGKEIVVEKWWDVLIFGFYLAFTVWVYGLLFSVNKIKETIKKNVWVWIWAPALGALGYFIALMIIDPLVIDSSLFTIMSVMGAGFALIGTFLATYTDLITQKHRTGLGFICGISASFSFGLCIGVIKGMGLGFMALAYALMGNILGISAAVVIIYFVRGMVWLKREGWSLENQEIKNPIKNPKEKK